VVDSHCHLADESFAADIEAVVERARAAGVERPLVILDAGNRKETEQASRVEALWPETRFAVGVHPHAAGDYADNPARAAEVVRAQFGSRSSARAIGEIGLDYHYDYAPREVQRDVFRSMVRLARELAVPIVVHTREADEDTLSILKREGGGEVRGVFHCFTGTKEMAQAGLDLGFYLSCAGIVTFPNAWELREVIRRIPADRLLVETDSPYLSPVPHRGRRNEPAFVAHVVNSLAELLGTSIADLAVQTTANFNALFKP
jgi:TatD DNase family protein